MFVPTQILRQNDRQSDVRAYRVADGERLWKRSSPQWQARVAASGDSLVSLSAEFRIGTVLTARDLVDGAERWSVDVVGMPKRPIVAGETVYVASDDQGVRAFDLATSDQRWHYEAETMNTVSVAATDTTAYLAEWGTLRVYDAVEGTEQWSISTGGASDFGGIAVDSETIYLGTGELPGKLLALSRSDGSERWRHRFPETYYTDYVDSGLMDRPTVVDGALYAAAVDGVYKFEPA